MNFSVNDSVVLNSFWGKDSSPQNVRDHENYWKLIGQKGVVVSKEEQSKLPRHARGERVLVKFDVDVLDFGLSCHNEFSNCLWIFISDLRHT